MRFRVFSVLSGRAGCCFSCFYVYDNSLLEIPSGCSRYLRLGFLWFFYLLEQEGSAARKLAIAVVGKCADKLEPYVRSFLTSVMVEGKSSDSGLHKDHHEIICELYGCAPQLLSGVIPYINDELVVLPTSVCVLFDVTLFFSLFGLFSTFDCFEVGGYTQHKQTNNMC